MCKHGHDWNPPYSKSLDPPPQVLPRGGEGGGAEDKLTYKHLHLTDPPTYSQWVVVQLLQTLSSGAGQEGRAEGWPLGSSTQEPR